ncbi:MAG: hypothetical protein M3552_15915 [Planctomycetota bacterium]|nr:hypothetical protein [Planctomycetota bacterium]
MANGQDEKLSEFCEKAIGPACVDFAARIGANEPSPVSSASQFGYKIDLPETFNQTGEKTVLVCVEPFDDEAFTVKASRPDIPAQLRQIALVRYDSIKDESAMADEAVRIRAKIGESLEALRESLSNRTS